MHGQGGRHRLLHGRGFALLLSREGYHAASVNYGMVPSDIDKLAARAGPIVASYGGRDWMVRERASAPRGPAQTRRTT